MHSNSFFKVAWWNVGGLNGKVVLSRELTLDEKLDTLFLIDAQFPVNKTAAPKITNGLHSPPHLPALKTPNAEWECSTNQKPPLSVQSGLHNVWITAEASTPILLHAAHWPCAGDPLKMASCREREGEVRVGRRTGGRCGIFHHV
mmetsp:Transcript_22890/g.38338  ORF Transcript_22890/g.38338 Transcript_22890/m.38338 type:complete len:145 (+) Transcript_22890:552-986(+)